ncbi:hypothetical protein IKF25_00725 [Candidatus Saccharibacteria bacterium]|nr:hypothetical protein [Candidatus Saccharibacteria bacterium]
MADSQNKPIRGRRNLIILAAGSGFIALATTVASLQIYRATGDIYLDRSRPGYIFDDEKHSEEDDQKESFSNEGEITVESLDEYLKELDTVIKRVDDSANDYSPEPLSDDSLGISVDNGEFRDDI